MNTKNAMIGIGGAPTRCTTLPEKADERKKYPIASGFMDYFGDAIAAISNLSQKGNDQHNPGKPLHWDRSKSGDEADTMMRHFLQRGTRDTDGIRHSAKMAWRALALLQKEIEAEQKPSFVTRYWRRNDPGSCDNGVIYRATSEDHVGEYWRNGKWTETWGEPMIPHAEHRRSLYEPITAKQAAAAGAEI